MNEGTERGGGPPPRPIHRRSAVVRAASLRLMAVSGEPDMEALYAGLRDGSLEVRIAAAETLGFLGDSGAVGPLREVLQSRWIGGSSRLQFGFGVLCAGLLVLFLWSLTEAGPRALLGVFMGLVLVLCGETVFRQRRERAALYCAVVEALACIAQRSPTAEVRAVLPDLRLVALDVLQQDGRTRRYSRAAAERIEAATRDLKSLPLAGAAPAPGGELPLPGGVPSDPEHPVAHRDTGRASA